MRDTDTDDYNNMVRATKFIQGTIGLPFILSIHSSVNIKWYFDADFAVYKDTSNHTGGFVTMGT